jgi:hypothetical protein
MEAFGTISFGGVVSHANAAAEALGIRTGQALRPQIEQLSRRSI